MDRIVGRISTGLLYLSGLCLLGLAAITVLEIIMRSVGYPTSWANDYVGYGLLASIFLAFPRVTRDKGHVAITFLLDNVPNRMIFKNIFNVISVLVLIATVVIGVQVLTSQIETGVQTVSATPIQKYWLTGFLLIGLVFGAAEFSLQVLKKNTSQHG